MSETRDRLLQAARDLKGWDGPSEVVRGLQVAGLDITVQQMANWKTRKVPDRFCHLAAEVLGCTAEWLIFGKVKGVYVPAVLAEDPASHRRSASAQGSDVDARMLHAHIDMLRKSAQIIAEQFGVSTEQVLASALSPKKTELPGVDAMVFPGGYRPPLGTPQPIILPTMKITDWRGVPGESDPEGSKVEQERRKDERRASDRRAS